MEILFQFDCGCLVTIDKTEIKTKNQNGIRYTHNRLCKEHDGNLVHKIIFCPECKESYQVKTRTNRKKCACGHTIHVLNGDKPKPKARPRAKDSLVKFCIFCGKIANPVNGDYMCTECHDDYHNDFDLIMFDSFAREVKQVGCYY